MVIFLVALVLVLFFLLPACLLWDVVKVFAGSAYVLAFFGLVLLVLVRG